MDNKRISKEIDYDIDTGVYNSFPRLKSRLEHISQKLIESMYIENREISEGEMKTLEENDYII